MLFRSVPVGPELIGRVVNSLGQPIDGKGPVNAKLTDVIEKVAPGVIENSIAQPVNEIPAGRLGLVEEVSNSVLFLSSGAADYVTGQVIEVDGGFSQTLIEHLPQESAIAFHVSRSNTEPASISTDGQSPTPSRSTE